MDSRSEPVVSIQRAAAPNALEGHLGWGVLVDPEVVLVPGPLPWLEDTTIRLEVLLASAQWDGLGFVERIGPRSVEVAAINGSPEGAVGLIELAHRSHHKHFESTVRVERLFEQFAVQTDVWTALETIDAVPRGIRERPVTAVLGVVVEWETTRRERLVTARHWIDPGAPRWPFCPKWIPGCMPGGPQWP
jgi:hypothetical protein